MVRPKMSPMPFGPLGLSSLRPFPSANGEASSPNQ
ncbi:hypothetical protein BN1708_018280 [Verticillium longisporum]|uniref:Uncharacterized protein n=1 Tax=Verticillium longisporum TaxID=100787 RepID=A0A0G4LZ54_VERLO|nr:hypothetical protein BN1708_018280 [Verticillium longisporum]